MLGLHERVLEKRAQNERLCREDEALKQQLLSEFGMRLGMISNRSYKPPSSGDPQNNKVRRCKKKSEKRSRVERGRRMQTRHFVPVAKIDPLEKLVPGACEKCG